MAKTPSPSTTRVAAEIRRRRPGIGKARLHKLLYYVQGYHLAWRGSPAFDDNIEAWEKGPVVAALWHAEKGGQAVESSEAPPELVCNVITYVLRRVGNCTGPQLIKATHSEAPWSDATKGGRFIASQVISHKSLTDFFSMESSDLKRIRTAVNATRDDTPFESDPPGLRDALMAELLSK